MAGAEISNLKARWSGGALIFEDLAGNAVITINASSGGVLLANAGGLTVSTGILGSLAVSGAVTVGGDLTISSGRLAFTGQKTENVTTSKTITATSSGVVQLVTASDVVVTLPGAGSTGKALCYTLINTITTAGQAVVITCTGEAIVGGLGSTAGVTILANTAATHKDGDGIQIVNNPGSTSWGLVGMTGTWASTT